MGPNELSFSEPGAVREIYTSDLFIKEESFYVSVLQIVKRVGLKLSVYSSEPSAYFMKISFSASGMYVQELTSLNHMSIHDKVSITDGIL